MPTIEESLLSIDKRLSRIERLLENKSTIKRTFVKVSVVKALTGWDFRFMQKARANGLVKYKETDGKFTYLLESIDEKWILRN